MGILIDLCPARSCAETGGQYISDKVTALYNSAHRRTTVPSEKGRSALDGSLRRKLSRDFCLRSISAIRYIASGVAFAKRHLR